VLVNYRVLLNRLTVQASQFEVGECEFAMERGSLDMFRFWRSTLELSSKICMAS
jgi:hypothetical protein